MFDTKWMQRASCAGMKSEIFFPTPKGAKVNPKQYREAILICSACPVRQECLSYALKLRMTEDGIFGGKMPHQRRMMLARAPKKKVKS